jgi:hypothetical protein
MKTSHEYEQEIIALKRMIENLKDQLTKSFEALAHQHAERMDAEAKINESA